MSEEFTNWLNKTLNKQGWSQRELARRSNLSSATVSKVAGGIIPPTFDFCMAISRPLKEDPVKLFYMAELLPGSGKNRGQIDEITMLLDMLEDSRLGEVRRFIEYQLDQQTRSSPLEIVRDVERQVGPTRSFSIWSLFTRRHWRDFFSVLDTVLNEMNAEEQDRYIQAVLFRLKQGPISEPETAEDSESLPAGAEE